MIKYKAKILRKKIILSEFRNTTGRIKTKEKKNKELKDSYAHSLDLLTKIIEKPRMEEDDHEKIEEKKGIRNPNCDGMAYILL